MLMLLAIKLSIIFTSPVVSKSLFISSIVQISMNKKPLSFESDAYHYNDSLLKVFRIHPDGCRIHKTEKTLQGKANKDALVWCGPYGIANSLGWWIYPGFDIDVTCHSSPVEGSFTGRWGGHFSYSIKSYDQSDLIQMKQFEDINPNKYGQRLHA